MNELSGTHPKEDIYVDQTIHSDDSRLNAGLREKKPEDAANDRDSLLGDQQNAQHPEVTYTVASILLNRTPTVRAANIMMFCLWFIIGLIQAYQGAVSMKLQEKKATMTQQAFFTIAAYPYTFKLIFAPFMDTYFNRTIGKCKTWLVPSTFLLGVMMTFLGLYIEDYLNPEKITTLTIAFLFVNLVQVLSHICSEMWIVKLYEDEDDKSKGSMVINFGSTIGSFVGFNLFIPLNHVGWLNEHFFTEHPRTEPLITDRQLLLFVAGLSFAFSAVVLIFFAERMASTELKEKSVGQVLCMIPKFFTNTNLLWYMGYQACFRIPSGIVASTVSLRMIDEGMQSADLTMVSSIAFPVYLVAAPFVMKLMKKGKLLQYGYVLTLIGSISSILSIFVFFDFERNHAKTRTLALLLVLSMFDSCIMSQVFNDSYVNVITNENVGSTFYTFMMCWNNTASIYSSSLGLKLVGMNIVNYDFFALFFLSLQVAVILPWKNKVAFLDSLSKRDFQFK